MKKIISIVIIFGALAGAGFFAYKAFSSSSSTAAPSQAATKTTSEILPLGTNLNFEQVKKFNKDARIFQYPAVSPEDIGPGLSTMIKQ